MSFWFSKPQIAASRTVDSEPGLDSPPTSALRVPLPLPGATPFADAPSSIRCLASPGNPVPAHLTAFSIFPTATDPPSLVPVTLPAPPPPPPHPLFSFSSLAGLSDKLTAVREATRQSLSRLLMPAWLASLLAIADRVVGPYRDIFIMACVAVQQSPYAGLVLAQTLGGGTTLTVKDVLMLASGNRPHAIILTKKIARYFQEHPATLDALADNHPLWLLVVFVLVFVSVFALVFAGLSLLGDSDDDPIEPAIRTAMNWLRLQANLRKRLDSILRPEFMLARLELIFASLFEADFLPFPSSLRGLLETPFFFQWFRALLWAALSAIGIFARSWLKKLAVAMPRRLRKPIEELSPTPHILTQFLEAFDSYISNELPTHLIRLQDMRLVGREEIREALRPRIATMTETNLMFQTLCHNLFHPSDQVGYHFTLAIHHYLRFAIFSHRWGPQEPTFRDMMEAGPKASCAFPEGPGLKKLLKFCEEARRYGCMYAWSDTCCINKESSSELQEAIRSMYRWYQNAEICIAYLGESVSAEDFEFEPWFTRGWTLQELLAPRKIRFYGMEWIPISWQSGPGANDKDSAELMEAVEKVTMIPQDDLRRFIPSCSRVYEKMIWASKRRTTRAEDRAYCLLGIFDITIAISYGEGPWAFHRLMEAILQRCGESGILAWSGKSSPYSLAIPASPACYMEDLRGAKEMPRLTEPITFTLTKEGLDVELFVIHAKMTSAHRRDKGLRDPWDKPQPSLDLVNVRFHDIILRPKWTLRSSWPKKPVQVSADERDLQRCSSWAIGIICSRDAKGRARLEPGKEYMWMLVGNVRNERKESVWVRARTRSMPTLRIERTVRSRLETVRIPHRL